jgi:hypothetical protein
MESAIAFVCQSPTGVNELLKPVNYPAPAAVAYLFVRKLSVAGACLTVSPGPELQIERDSF